MTPSSPGDRDDCGKVGEGCSGERIRDQHGSVLDRRESFLSREDRALCSEQDLVSGKKLFSRADG